MNAVKFVLGIKKADMFQQKKEILFSQKLGTRKNKKNKMSGQSNTIWITLGMKAFDKYKEVTCGI